MLLFPSPVPLALKLLVLGSALHGSPPRYTQPYPAASSLRHTPFEEWSPPRSAHPMLMIRVSQESAPGAADFDTHILGFVRALQTTGDAADFYMYGKIGPNYGNTIPALSSNTSHLFFVNAADGLALFMVHNNTNHSENGRGGSAKTQWALSGGIAAILRADDGLHETWANGETFTGDMNWSQENTDGMVIGALPVGFTILGQFLEAPKGLGGGWVVISDDGTRIPLSLLPGQRVRLDVALHVRVKQDH